MGLGIQQYLLKARASVLQVERTPSSSHWKHHQMSYVPNDIVCHFPVWNAYGMSLFFTLAQLRPFTAWRLNCSGCLDVGKKVTTYLKVSCLCGWFAVVQCFSVTLPCVWLPSLTEWGMRSLVLEAVSCCVVGGCPYMEVWLGLPKSLPWPWKWCSISDSYLCVPYPSYGWCLSSSLFPACQLIHLWNLSPQHMKILQLLIHQRSKVYF